MNMSSSMVDSRNHTPLNNVLTLADVNDHCAGIISQLDYTFDQQTALDWLINFDNSIDQTKSILQHIYVQYANLRPRNMVVSVAPDNQRLKSVK